MEQAYGCDDMEWLQKQSKEEGMIQLEAHGQMYELPFGRFDNRIDQTSFLIKTTDEWPAENIQSLHQSLKTEFSKLKPQ